MLIDITKFHGIAPLVNPLALGDGYAQVALDCDLRGGVLAPMRGTRQVMTIPVGTKSLHKFGWQNAAEDEWWFTFDQDVDVVKAAYPGDVEERTYFTGPWPSGTSKLRKTRLGMGNSGSGPYPTTYLDGSVPAPTGLILATPSGGDADADPRRLAYVETFVTTWDEESEPGPPSVTITANSGATVDLTNLTAAPTGSHDIDRRRIYRTEYTGSATSDYQLVVELPVGTVTYSDDLTDEINTDVLATRGWDAAPEGLMGLIELPGQYMGAFKDFDAYFSEPGAPYAWPTAHSQTLGSAVVGLGSYGQTVVAITRGHPYIGIGASPSELLLQKADVPSDCVGGLSKRGIVSAPGAVFAPTKHGLAVFSPSGAENVTRRLLDQKAWAEFAPATMLGALHGARYIGFYDTGSVQRGLILDPGVEGLVQTSIHATARHVIDGTLYLAVGTNLVAFDEGDTFLPYTWRSRKYFSPKHSTNAAVAKVIANSYPVTLKVYADGELRAEKTVTSGDEVTLPSGYTASTFEVQIEGEGKVRRVAIAETSDELRDISA